MGGMNAFDWAVRHPEFVDAVVPIAGSPRSAAWDRLLAVSLLSLIDDGRRGGASPDSIWARYARLEMLFVRTPAALNKDGPTRVAADVESAARDYARHWALEDAEAHVRVLRDHDITGPFGGDLARTAAAVRARLLVVYSWDDHLVTAGPAAEFASLAKADTLSIRSPCGHVALFCEKARIGAAVRAFLAR
jgi:homoserine O-acetyltransferase